MEKNEAIGKPCNPLRQWKSIKAECQPKATKGAVMVEGYASRVYQQETIHNTKLVPTKYQKRPEDKQQDPKSQE